MHILIVEDNPTLQEALQLHFTDDGHLVTALEDGEQALHFLVQEPFDCCILDVNLPHMSGLEVLRAARRKGVTMPILLLTARDEVADRVAGLDAGADDYLTKPFEMAELDARLRALLRREPRLRDDTSQIGQLTLHHAARHITHRGTILSLSAKEVAVLEMLSDTRNQLVAKSQLIQNIYGVGAEVNETTIEVLISRLRKKLAPYDVQIKTMRGLGYYLKEE